MMTRRILSLGALAVLAACSGARGGSSSSPSASNAGLPWVTSRAQGGDVVERAVAQKATGAQAGTVRQVNDRFIVIDPYESWAGDAQIAIAKDTPVFRGGDRVRESVKDAVKPGQEVNVYFDQKNGAPVAMGIKLLSADEARQLRTAISQRTRPSGSSAPASSQPSSSGILGSSSSGDASTGSADSGSQPFGAAPSQSGRISSISGTEIVLDPYQESSGQTRLRIGPDVQVRRGGERVGREALRNGEDVRVFYEPGSMGAASVTGNRGAPRVLGVEILSDEEAARMRQSAGGR